MKKGKSRMNNPETKIIVKELLKLTRVPLSLHIKIDSKEITIFFQPGGGDPPFLTYSPSLPKQKQEELIKKLAVRVKQLKRFVSLFKDKESEFLAFHSLTDQGFASLSPLEQVYTFSREKIKAIEAHLRELGPAPSRLGLYKQVLARGENSIGHISWYGHKRAPYFIDIHFPVNYPIYQEMDVLEEAAEEFEEEMKIIKKAFEGRNRKGRNAKENLKIFSGN